MALKAKPAKASDGDDYNTWPVEKLEARRDELAAERTRIRLEQNAVDAALSAARAIDGLSPEQRAAFAARAAAAKE